jgi:hypothetical protein
MRTKTENPLPKTLPGAICAQMVRCGKATCKCARGELHGPYFYHFERVGGRLIKRYVRAEEAEQFRAACQARREEERQHRQTHKASVQQLVKIIEQLRDNEKLLLQFLGRKHG